MTIATSALLLLAVLAAFAATFVREAARAGLWTIVSLLALAAALAALGTPIAAFAVSLLALGPVAAPVLAGTGPPEDPPVAPAEPRARRRRRLEIAAAVAWIVAVALLAPLAVPGRSASEGPAGDPAVPKPGEASGRGARATAGSLFGDDLLALAGAAGLAAMAVVAARPRKEAS